MPLDESCLMVSSAFSGAMAAKRPPAVCGSNNRSALGVFGKVICAVRRALEGNRLDLMPCVASSIAPGRVGMCSRVSAAPTFEDLQMFIKCPANPKPVTSVMAWAVPRAVAASAWGVVMWESAASTQSPRAFICISAAIKTPEPMGFVRTRRSPGCAPARVIGAWSKRPVADKPMVNSEPILVWPPMISAFAIDVML